jgi:hypothetical protein
MSSPWTFLAVINENGLPEDFLEWTNNFDQIVMRAHKDVRAFLYQERREIVRYLTMRAKLNSILRMSHMVNPECVWLKAKEYRTRAKKMHASLDGKLPSTKELERMFEESAYVRNDGRLLARTSVQDDDGVDVPYWRVERYHIDGDTPPTGEYLVKLFADNGVRLFMCSGKLCRESGWRAYTRDMKELLEKYESIIVAHLAVLP